ncbi:MFS transporter [Spirochaeta isovalerica]|uniref:GPH family glycoside/pentoside/hexuronide:cation symporter/probable glucitol transport protein GutA n=1 Tax=Spirochaeta isovalerica TaxID=150 RepID=A0A841RAJ2_9SPIO|nr:glycoside-pentoside-hexuronide (GPH):cation symporter [Spirochaeta isovalerica]MBB6479939.1 GPH family glycoside/pentoside/hexuronide:cation symporter/probable glucitol transport protein GutA [Spirochaeta isovalerica]
MKKALSIQVSLREKISFAGALGGQNLMYTFVNFFILIFYTDVMGISPAAAGLMFLVARIWDAFNDLIMGMIVDRTRSRWGKCRPYLIFMSFPIAVTTAIMFIVPDLEYGGRIVYMWVTYIIWGMAYTSGDISLWTLAGRISPRTEDRNLLISWGRVAGAVGTAAAVLATVPLKNLLGGDKGGGYFAVAVIFCLLGFLAIFQGGLITRERTFSHDPDQKISLKDSLVSIFANGPLLLVLLSLLLTVIPSLQMVMMMYFAKYNLQNEGLMTVIAGISLVTMALGSGLVPWLTRFISGKKLVLYSGFVLAFLGTAMYFIGYENLLIFYVFAALWGLFNGFPEVIRTTMIANTVEWMEKKTGKRSDGTIFSTLTFIGKLTAGLGKFVAGLLLTYYGFIANTAQSPQVLDGLFQSMTIIPGIGSLIMILPLFFYNIDEKTHAKLVKDLALESES